MYCQSRKIPNEVLKRIACDLFGWNSFDEDAFREAVDRITVIYPNELIFHMKDDSERKTEWQHESCAKSWTPEMRAQAVEHARRKWLNQ